MSSLNLSKRPLEEYCCLNKSCSTYGKRNNGNIKIVRYYGKNNDIRLLICTICEKTFSERKNTSLYNSKVNEDKAISIIHHLAEGNGIRRTHRLTGASKQTVQRLSKMSGNHSYSIHEELVKDLQVEEVELDEKWSFVEKKRQELKTG